MAGTGGWQVVPGRSLGPFSLGMTVTQALALLQERHGGAHVDVFHAEADPVAVDTVVSVEALGFKLRFEPRSQRLRLIDVHDASRLVLRYGSTAFSGPGVPASFIRVYELFGPTFPGELNVEKSVYFLHYRGVSFVFPIPPAYHQLYRGTNEMPLELPDATTPVACRMFLYTGTSLLRPAVPPSAMSDPVHVLADVRPSDGRAVVHLAIAGGAPWATSFDFSSSAQDVLSALGAPSGVMDDAGSWHGSESEPGKLSSAQESSSRAPARPGDPARALPAARPPPGAAAEVRRRRDDGRKSSRRGGPVLDGRCRIFEAAGGVWLSYHELGVDVLVDAKTRRVSKIVLRTNLPGHAAFNLYAATSFCLRVPLAVAPPSVHSGDSTGERVGVKERGPLATPKPHSSSGSGAARGAAASIVGAGRPKAAVEEAAPAPAPAAHGLAAAGGAGSDAGVDEGASTRRAVTHAEVTSSMTWREIEALLGPAGRPMVRAHGGAANPFGPTFLYAYDGLIFEVLKTGFVASVLLFAPA